MRTIVTCFIALAHAACGGPGGTTDPADTAAAPDSLPGACPATPVQENTNALCRNGLDDDCNGWFDCFDFACARGAGVDACCGDGGREDTDGRCENGIDDDCDGYVDCRDFDCSVRNAVTTCCGGGAEDDDEACGNRWDDDCDGYVDCADFDCAATNGVTACCGDGGPEDTDAGCQNGVDDDCNGYIDCKDFSCSKNASVRACCQAEPERGAAACSDLADDDCDGKIDCADEDCATDPAITTCQAACTASGAESSDAVCGNGKDDDCDGYTDCVDFSCQPTPACSGGGEAADCDPCARGADCEGGACVSYPNAPEPRPRFCSGRCESDADCGPALPRCGASGFCSASEAQLTETCNADGKSFTIRDGCGHVMRIWTCAAGETCAMVSGQARCQAPCVDVLGACTYDEARPCCDGLHGENTLGSTGINCICFRDDGAPCGQDEECSPELSECGDGGTCTTCMRVCDSDNDCCAGWACASWGQCGLACNPAECHAFCVEPYGCCDQHCSGTSCVTDHCSF